MRECDIGIDLLLAFFAVSLKYGVELEYTRNPLDDDDF